MTNTKTIPLDKLTPWDGNVRKTGASDGIDELAASIASHGLLQSLVVRKTSGKSAKFEIVAGHRRYLALKALVKKRKLPKDHPVPCTLADAAINASEISLAENVVRIPMHPADQFEAFASVIDSGAGVADVAARFGVSESLVAKRMRLGRLSPVILQAYRDEQIGLEEAQAFALSDDHEAQERVFGELSSFNRHAHTIRRALTADEIPASDKRVQFVGLEAYEASGGAVRRDLFGEQSYVQDTPLLDRLVAEKLSTVAGEISAEGWRWVETVADLDYEHLRQFSHHYPERVDLSDEDQAQLDKFTQEYDEQVDTDDDAAFERLEEIECRIDELSAKAETWPAETLSIAGAIVTLCHNGAVRIERGLVRKQDEPKAEPDASDGKPKAATLSAKLVSDLTAQKSAAIGAELASQPDVALSAVTHALTLQTLYRYAGDQSCLQIRLMPPALHSAITYPENAKGLQALDQVREGWGKRLPENPADLWDWCITQTRDVLLDLLAFSAAHLVDAVQRKDERETNPRLAHANALATALQFGMGDYFTPGAANYFARISKPAILDAIDEAKGGHGPALDNLKKAELADRAEQIVADTGWLPAPLRIAGQSADASEPSETAETLPEAAE